MPTNPNVIRGRIMTWKAKKRVSVAAPTSSPPRRNRAIAGPAMGTLAAISVPTLVAKYEIWFHGSRYPLNPNPSIRPSSAIPVSQVSSRGRRYACVKTTLNMCTKAARISRLADQL